MCPLHILGDAVHGDLERGFRNASFGGREMGVGVDRLGLVACATRPLQYPRVSRFT